MENNKASITSLVSAFSRAYHSKYDSNKIFDDFIAKDLITPREFTEISNHMIRGISFFNPEVANRFHDQPDKILKWITQVQLSPTPLARAAYCEDKLAHEILLGVRQYVILGAGLDTFCFRHPELKDSLEIFEIDHPDTHNFKQKRLANVNYPIPSNLRFVSMDFTKEFSVQRMVEGGFIPSKKTFFSFLGVSYYLTKQENVTLLNKLFARVPSGSSLVFDYADDRLFEEKGMYNRVQNMVRMASAGGEPMKSCYTYDEMEKMLEKADLLIYEHLSPLSIQKQFFRHRTDYLSAFETIHYIHAVKK